jgi:hypothetical protein
MKSFNEPLGVMWDDERWELENRRRDLYSAVRHLCSLWENGQWTLEDDRKLGLLIGLELPPWERGAPPCDEFLTQCLAHQLDNKREPLLRLGCVDVEWEDRVRHDDERKHQLLEEIVNIGAAIRTYLLTRGHDLCWEHIVALAGILPENRGDPTTPQRPKLATCMRYCARYREGIDRALGQ